MVGPSKTWHIYVDNTAPLPWQIRDAETQAVQQARMVQIQVPCAGRTIGANHMVEVFGRLLVSAEGDAIIWRD